MSVLTGLNFLCPHIFPRLWKVKQLGIGVKVEMGGILKHSVGKFFVLKLDLVYIDLGALFEFQGLLSLNRLTGPDNSNDQ